MPPKGARSKSPTGRTPTKTKSRSRSPQASSSGIDKAVIELLMKAKLEDVETDYKSIKIPLFSDGTEWEEVVFELEVNLEKIWKHQKELDIVDYLHGTSFYCDQKWKDKADKMIYYILVTGANILASGCIIYKSMLSTIFCGIPPRDSFNHAHALAIGSNINAFKSKPSNHITKARKLYNIKNIIPSNELSKKTG